MNSLEIYSLFQKPAPKYHYVQYEAPARLRYDLLHSEYLKCRMQIAEIGALLDRADNSEFEGRLKRKRSGSDCDSVDEELQGINGAPSEDPFVEPSVSTSEESFDWPCVPFFAESNLPQLQLLSVDKHREVFPPLQGKMSITITHPKWIEAQVKHDEAEMEEIDRLIDAFPSRPEIGSDQIR